MNLEFLLLQENQLAVLPLEVSRLSRLQKLNLEHNRLECVPDALVILPQLAELNVAHNTLRALPPLIVGMKQLAVLRCMNNPFLRDCPKGIRMCAPIAHHKRVPFCERHMFLLVLAEIISAGDAAVRSYLRALAVHGEVRVNRVKLIIVGNENVGKVPCISAQCAQLL